MKILLTGKDGQVGFELQRSLATLGELVALDLADCDLSDAQAIRQLVSTVRPSVIVNPAAYTAVDKAETDVARAQCSFQFFICEQIELLLNLALNVLGTAGTQDIDQTGLVDIAVDDLGA